MAVDFKTFRKVSKFVVDVRKPVLLRGRHGIGKSEVVYQIAKDLNLPVVERRASQMTEGDLVGLPTIADDSTQFNPPDWFKAACDRPVLLFLDEVDRAIIEVRQGIFELTDSRKLNGYHLHEDTVIFAAINGGEHGAQYQVGDMDPAELDRWTVFDVEPTLEDWLDWGKDNVCSLVWDFVNNNRTHLEHEGEFEPNKVYPSRRSWKRLNDCLENAGLLQDKSTLSSVFDLSAAFVGFEAAIAFRDYIETYEKQVTVEDIITNGKIELTDEFGINEHSAMIDKMQAEDLFAQSLQPDQLENLARYFFQLPSEVCMKLWQVMGEGEEANVIGLHKCKVDGKAVYKYFVEILNPAAAAAEE